MKIDDFLLFFDRWLADGFHERVFENGQFLEALAHNNLVRLHTHVALYDVKGALQQILALLKLFARVSYQYSFLDSALLREQLLT